MIKNLLFAILLCSGMYYYWNNKPVVHGPGEVAPEAPVQESIYNGDKLSFRGVELTPKATISFEARVLSLKNYFFDEYSELVPTDVVFGWGPMSDERNLNSLLVQQSDRSFYWEMIKPPIERGKMWRNAANMHLIGSTIEIRNKISSLREGHVVRIEGKLVDAKSPNGWSLKTSLTRDDIGNNSSELVWINSLTIL